MSLPELDNLVRIGQLKAEPRNVQEAMRMLAMASTRLSDANLNKLSIEGRLPVPTTPPTPPRWPHCAGTATEVKTATPFFSA